MDLGTESAVVDYDEGPSMALHRVRFVDWSPSAVTSIAFLQGEGRPSSSSSSSRSVMAVGYENGNISLCVWVQDESIPSPSTSAANGSSSSVLPKGWQVDTTLVGSTPSKVDTLAFLFTSSTESMHKQPRLFSTSGGSIIVEHTLPPHLIQLLQDTGNGIWYQNSQATFKSGLTRTISSQGGSVWCMAASPLGRYLAIGCEDGHVRIIDIQDNRFELLAASRSARRAGDGSIEGIVNTFDRAKTRIVSLAWGAPKRKDSAAKTKSNKAARQSDDESDESSSDDDDDDDDEEDWEESFILGGTTHSSALIWSTATGRVESKVLVDKRRNEQTIVWSVAVLRDGTLVLGDSLGHVSLFDGKNRTLLPSGRFANHAKGADVLAVCVGTDGKTVYSAGLDQKVIEYALVKDVDERKDKWICTGNRRLHAHDIRALAMDPPFSLHPVQQQSRPHTYRVPILVSGGSDFSLVYTPASSPSQLMQLKAASKKNKNGKASAGMRQSIVQYDEVNPVSTSPFTTFADTIQRRIPFVPSTGRSGALGGGGIMRVCASRGWVMLRRETSLGIWRLPQMTNAAAAAAQQQEMDVGETAETTPAWTKLLEMQLKVKSNIVCADISNDGKYLAVADLYETKLYFLQSSSLSGTIVPERIKSFGRAFQDRSLHSCPGSSAMAFTPDNTRLILASQPGGYLHVVELPSSGSAAAAGQGPCRLLKSFDQHRKRVPGRAVAGRKEAGGGAAGKAKSNSGHSDGDVTNGAAGHHSDDNSAGEEDDDQSDEQVLFARIDVLQISPDGQYLVSVDTYKRVHTFSLDTLHFHRSLPSVPHVPSSIAFDLSKPGRLCLILPTNQVILHNLEERANNNVSSSKEDQGLVDAIMERIITIRESAIGAVWLTSSQLIVWGSTWICTARAKSPSLSASTTAAKRGRSAEEVQTPSDAKAGWNVTLTFKYQPLLHVGLVASASASASGKKGRKEDELIVVERPYYDIARTLPPSWFSGSTYGT